jgi:tetratricopeptide (TPR) repeat protein
MFPQLLSHRDLVTLVKQATSSDADIADDQSPAPECSVQLKEMKKRAGAATRRHDVPNALAAWRDVRDQALAEGNEVEAVLAKLETALIAAESEGDLAGALTIAEECLQEMRQGPLRHRARALQLIGEIHRNSGETGKAKAALTLALEHARASGSKVDVAFALLSLAGLDIRRRKHDASSGGLDEIEAAYTALSTLRAEGDDEQRRNAIDGLAHCHCFRAEIFDHIRPDDALAEWSRALELFRSLGEGWEWYVGDTLLRRADLHARIGDGASAAQDLDDAVSAFRTIENLPGLADCFLKAGELLDSVGRREEAAEQYRLAAQVASSLDDERRASYFYFRYAFKLLEQRKYDDAEVILTSLVESSALNAEQKLEVLDQMCLLAEAKRDEGVLRERAERALALTDEILREATSAERRRSLLKRKGHQLERLGRTDDAVKAFHDAIDRLDPVADRLAIAECWFQIRGLYQKTGDRKGEREASEKVLLIGGENLSSVLKAFTLAGLAQLNIADQRFAEAKEQLDRALELEPENPVVRIFQDELERKLAQVVPARRPDSVEGGTIPHRVFAELIHELHAWCAAYPRKQNAILAVWYYIHRKELWSIFRSMLGVKFLVATRNPSDFDSARTTLCQHGDLFVWGTNFPLKTSRGRGVKGFVQIPVPKGFLYPAGTSVLSPAQKEPPAGGRTSQKRGILEPVKKLRVEPYYLAFMKASPDDPHADAISGISPFFVGCAQKWTNRKVISFMIERASADVVDGRAICLPLNEGDDDPMVHRVMQVASEQGAVPIFTKQLSDTSRVSAVCDTALQIPDGSNIGTSARQALWSELLACSGGPAAALTRFRETMLPFANAVGVKAVPVRVYMLRFRSADQDVVHPAIVLTDGSKH